MAAVSGFWSGNIQITCICHPECHDCILPPTLLRPCSMNLLASVTYFSKNACAKHLHCALKVIVEALMQDKALRESLKVAIPKRVSLQLRMWSRLKALGMLYVLLVVTLPISLMGMAAAIFWHIAFYVDLQSPRIPPNWRGTALVSGELSPEQFKLSI